MVWKADLIQGVLFPVPTLPQIDALEAWQLAFEDQPEAFRRPPNPLQLSQAEGTSAGVRMTISAQFGRLDVNATPLPPTAPTQEAVQIEDLSAAAEEVTRVLISLCHKVKIVRAALVGNLSQSLNTDAEVVARLVEETGGVWFPHPPLDSLYQLNVRRQYNVPDKLGMNRVLTWSAGFRQIVTMPIDQASTVSQLPIIKSTPLISFKIDVNSATASDITEQRTLIFSENKEEFLILQAEGLRRLQ